MKILPVFIPHLGCPADCIYCNQKSITKSQQPVPSEIARMVENFCRHNAGKEKEIAFFGGTFTNLSLLRQQAFFDVLKPFLNNETSIRISTRPDSVSQDILDLCRQNGVKTIELGVQSFVSEILKTAGRNYTGEVAVSACRLVRQNKFRLGIQLMPGLPGFSRQSMQKTIQTTIRLKPDYVRIYPTIVLKGTILAEWYKMGNYTPLTLSEAIQAAKEMSAAFRSHGIKVIKIGLHSDIDPGQILAGPYHQSFGELVRAECYLEKLLAEFQRKTLCISPADVSLFKGFQGDMMNRLKSELKMPVIPVLIVEKLPKDKFLFTDISPQDYW